MNFDDYCQTKAAPEGSSTYYALRRASAASRPLLTALFALYRELDETVRQTSDPTIGRTKHAWWQSELGRLDAGEPTHPVTKALHAHGQGQGTLDHTALATLADGLGMDLDQARYLDWPGLQRYLERTGGAFATMLAHSTARDPARASSWAAPLGAALMLAERVQDIGDDARHGRIYIPIDELQRYNVTAADIINRKYRDAFVELMRFQTNRARRALDDATAAIPREERGTQRVLLALAAMSRARLDEIERAGFQVLHQQITLTPIRKLWISWRAR